MSRIKCIKSITLGLMFVITGVATHNVFAKDESFKRNSGSRLYPQRILTSIDMDMTLKDVKFLLGQPDRRSYFGHSKMTYGRLQIIFSEKNRVKEIQYHGTCGFVPLKKRDFNILTNPRGVRSFVIEALSRNDLLCPGHAFNRRITECIAEVMDYVYGT
jgi:hypothetical protein